MEWTLEIFAVRWEYFFFRHRVYKNFSRGMGGKEQLVIASSKQEGLIGYSSAPNYHAVIIWEAIVGCVCWVMKPWRELFTRSVFRQDQPRPPIPSTHKIGRDRESETGSPTSGHGGLLPQWQGSLISNWLLNLYLSTYKSEQLLDLAREIICGMDSGLPRNWQLVKYRE